LYAAVQQLCSLGLAKTVLSRATQRESKSSRISNGHGLELRGWSILNKGSRTARSGASTRLAHGNKANTARATVHALIINAVAAVSGEADFAGVGGNVIAFFCKDAREKK
jgi:hypothetical protein